MVLGQIWTDRVVYVLNVVDELFDNDVVKRAYVIEEHDLMDNHWSGSSRMNPGVGMWGMILAGLLPDIGIKNLFESEEFKG